MLLALIPAPASLPPPRLAQAGLARRRLCLDAKVLGLGLQLHQLPPGVGQRNLAVAEEIQY